MNSPTQVNKCAPQKKLLLLTLAFAAGAALSAAYFHSKPVANPVASETSEQTLSEPTKKLLSHLDSPLEIRFYSLMDTSSVPDSVQAFSKRVDDLLGQYQQESGGRLKIRRFTAFSSSSAAEAAHDGIIPFNVEKGDACFFGIAVARNGQKQVIPYLAPEWELALEADLTRALARTLNSGGSAISDAVVPVSPVNVDSIKQIIPNSDAVTLEQGTQLLRDAGLKEFKQATQEFQTKMDELQNRYAQASDAEKPSVLNELQSLQTEQNQRLKKIAAKSKAQIETFQKLKGSTPN